MCLYICNINHLSAQLANMFIISAVSQKKIKGFYSSLWRRLTNERLGASKPFNMHLPNGLFKERTPNPFFLDTAHLYTPENSHGTITNITQLEKENHGKSSNQSNPNLHFWGWTMLKHVFGVEHANFH